MTKPAKYYILDTRTCVGNCAMWWCPNGSGYTCNLDEAWLVGDDFVTHRVTDQKVPEAEARAMAVTHVRWEGLSKYLMQARDAAKREAKANAPKCEAMTAKNKRCTIAVAHDCSREGQFLCAVHIRQARRREDERLADIRRFDVHDDHGPRWW